MPTYRVYVLDDRDHIVRVYQLETCRDDFDAMTACNALARKHDHVQLWNGGKLVQTHKRTPSSS